MASPVFNAMGGVPGGGNFARMMQQFNQFRRQFNGNPKQMVMQMVQSGRISQAQLDQAQQMARQLMQQMYPFIN